MLETDRPDVVIIARIAHKRHLSDHKSHSPLLTHPCICCSLTIQCGCLKAGLLPQESHLAMSAPWLLIWLCCLSFKSSEKRTTSNLTEGLFPPTTISRFYNGGFVRFCSFSYPRGQTHVHTHQHRHTPTPTHLQTICALSVWSFRPAGLMRSLQSLAGSSALRKDLPVEQCIPLEYYTHTVTHTAGSNLKRALHQFYT